MIRSLFHFPLALLLGLLPSTLVLALDADELLVVANSRMAGSQELAEYYMRQRQIPADHLLITKLPLTETMARTDYERDLAEPVRATIARLRAKGVTVAGIVLIYGVPLKVLEPPPSRENIARLAELNSERQRLEQQDQGSGDLLEEIKRSITTITGTDQRAAVDSELMLVQAPTPPLAGWIENPYFLGFQQKTNLTPKNQVVVVARLDGPDLKTVYRIIDDSLAAEEEGLSGIAYFDARWPEPKDDAELGGYRRWDKSLHTAARLVAPRMEVRLDSRDELFAPGSAPNGALYCGWYSLGRYVDSFTWNRGAIGYHIASSECTTLRDPQSTVWCPQLLSHGVAATIGPVCEPYVQGFPLPEIFFGALAEGYMNLGESYLISLPYISWQMVLVGDPLYRPFQPLPTPPTAQGRPRP